MRILGLDIRRAGDLRHHRSVVELLDTVQRLEITVKGLQDELSQLQGHHLKLRKQFDGSKGGRPPGVDSAVREVDAIPVGDKASLRAYAGLRPGQPARIR